MVRSTYALDLDPVRTLDRLAERWGVAERAAPKGQGALEALDALQASLKRERRASAAASTGVMRSSRRTSE